MEPGQTCIDDNVEPGHNRSQDQPPNNNSPSCCVLAQCLGEFVGSKICLGREPCPQALQVRCGRYNGLDIRGFCLKLSRNGDGALAQVVFEPVRERIARIVKRGSIMSHPAMDRLPRIERGNERFGGAFELGGRLGGSRRTEIELHPAL